MNNNTDTNIVFNNKFDFTESQFAEFVKFLTQNEDLNRTYWRQDKNRYIKFDRVKITEAYYKYEIIGLIIFKS